MIAARDIVCAFIDGPLQGQQIRVDLETHRHVDRKTGAEYVRETTGRDGALVSYFRLRTRLTQQANNGPSEA
jgi:hypothetical protein